MTKLMLNSFWGNFGENLHKRISEAIHNAHHLFALVSNPLNDLRQVRLSNDEALKVVYAKLKENQLDNRGVNIFIAAFTLVTPDSNCTPTWSNFKNTCSTLILTRPSSLSNLVNRIFLLEADGDFIVEYTSAGPKNYSYKTHQGKVCCKARGFALNVCGSQQLNYDAMRQNLIDEISQPLNERRNVDVVNPNFFWRNPATKHHNSHNTIKHYGLVFDKCVVDPNTFHIFALRIHPGHLIIHTYIHTYLAFILMIFLIPYLPAYRPLFFN